MRSLSILLAVVAGLALSAPAAGAPEQPSYEALFESVWKTVDENFYDPTFRGVDWPAVGRRYRTQLPAVKDDAAFARLTGAMLSELKSSHLYLSPPAPSAARRIGPGVRFEDFDGSPVVVEVAPLSDARRQGVKVGDRLLSPRADASGPLGSRAALDIETCEGGRRRVEVARESAFWPPEHPGWRWSRLSPAPKISLGYLRIDRFDDGAAELADQAMAELADTDGLIIDLRGNSGGNISALRLASHFSDAGEQPAVALLARPWLQALGRRPTAADIAAGPKVTGAYTTEAVFKAVGEHGGAAVFHTERVAAPYRRPVAVLIGPETGSAAEGFAWAMRFYGQATFVGRRTAAALLSGERFDVGGGWTLTVPVHGLWGPQGQDLGDAPVSPDILVAPTRAAVCAGRDLELEAATDLLRRR